MKKIITLFMLLFLLVGCSSQAKIDSLWNNPNYQEQITNLENKSDNLMILNSRVVEMFPEYKKVQETHNPYLLTHIERILLFDMCFDLIYSKSTKSNVPEDNFESEAIESIYNEYGIDYVQNQISASGHDWVTEIYPYIKSYLAFQCLSGYPIFKSQMKAIYKDSYFNYEKIIYTEESFDLNTMFLDVRTPSPESIMKNFSLIANLSKEEGFVYEREINWRKNIIYLENPSLENEELKDKKPRSVEELKLFVKQLEDNDNYKNINFTTYLSLDYIDYLNLEFIEQRKKSIEKREEEENIELITDKEFIDGVSGEVITQEVQQEIEEEIKQNIKRSEEVSQQYDFPEIRKNKEDLILISQYSPLLKKALKDYNRIGLQTETKSYTFILSEGSITDIKEGLDNVEFTITTTASNAINMFDIGVEGNVKGLLSIVKELDMPFTVKLKILKSII